MAKKRDKLFIEAEKKLCRYSENLIKIDNLTVKIQSKLDFYEYKGLPGEQSITYDRVRVSKTNSTTPIEDWLLNHDKEYDELITTKLQLVKEVNLVKNALKILTKKELDVINARYIDLRTWDEVASKVGYSEVHCKRLRVQAINRIKHII